MNQLGTARIRGKEAFAMVFPETQLTLIRRIAAGGSEQDWRQFLLDYWGPICRFAARRASLSVEDAEDVASKTFEALLNNRLLARWHANRIAKLRTLLCGVVRNVLSNRARVCKGREQLLKEYVEKGNPDGPLPVHSSPEVPQESVDGFYAAWADDLLRHAVDALMDHYHHAGKGDYFRVLYGRLCEEATMPEISKALSIKVTTAENYYKGAKKRLREELRSRVRRHVQRYCDQRDVDCEFEAEWTELAEFLHRRGGLEQAVRSSYQQMEISGCERQRSDSFLKTVERFSRASS